MAKNLLLSVMATSFRRSEITAGNVTKQPVLAHEAITSSFRESGGLTISVKLCQISQGQPAGGDDEA
jgi:hypothetical protein